jgi:hypothetical protein
VLFSFLSLSVFFSQKQNAQRISHENYARFREITEAIVFMTGKSLAWILRAASSCVVIIAFFGPHHPLYIFFVVSTFAFWACDPKIPLWMNLCPESVSLVSKKMQMSRRRRRHHHHHANECEKRSLQSGNIKGRHSTHFWSTASRPMGNAKRRLFNLPRTIDREDKMKR